MSEKGTEVVIGYGTRVARVVEVQDGDLVRVKMIDDASEHIVHARHLEPRSKLRRKGNHSWTL